MSESSLVYMRGTTSSLTNSVTIMQACNDQTTEYKEYISNKVGYDASLRLVPVISVACCKEITMKQQPETDLSM